MADLMRYEQFSDKITYVNQKDIGDCYKGSWFYGDDENLVIYYGTFGNFNSPGSRMETEEFETQKEYQTMLAKWKNLPEYL